MNSNTSTRFKFFLGIVISIISILGFFGIKQFTDIGGHSKKDTDKLKQLYFHGTTWIGSWTDKDQGITYTAKMKLSISVNGEIDGAIKWKFTKSSYAESQYLIDTEAVEVIKGDYNPENEKVTLRGIEKEDPNDIIMIAIYNLTLSEDKQNLQGFDSLTGGIVKFKKTK